MFTLRIWEFEVLWDTLVDVQQGLGDTVGGSPEVCGLEAAMWKMYMGEW